LKEDLAMRFCVQLTTRRSCEELALELEELLRESHPPEQGYTVTRMSLLADGGLHTLTVHRGWASGIRISLAPAELLGHVEVTLHQATRLLSWVDDHAVLVLSVLIPTTVVATAGGAFLGWWSIPQPPHVFLFVFVLLMATSLLPFLALAVVNRLVLFLARTAVPAENVRALARGIREYLEEPAPAAGEERTEGRPILRCSCGHPLSVAVGAAGHDPRCPVCGSQVGETRSQLGDGSAPGPLGSEGGFREGRDRAAGPADETGGPGGPSELAT
jgi:hypothetical protein